MRHFPRSCTACVNGGLSLSTVLHSPCQWTTYTARDHGAPLGVVRASLAIKREMIVAVVCEIPVSFRF